MQKYWPILVTGLGFVVQAFTPAAHTFWLSHPVAATSFNAVWTQVCHFLPPPTKS